MPIWKSYLLAHSVEEALEALARSPGEARPVAGGTDLLLDLQQGRHPPLETLVDVTHIPEMRVIEIRPPEVYIGAAVPLNQIVNDRILQEHAPALVEAAGLIGGPQVRNTATLGGNVAHALPAGDGTIALFALGAIAEAANAQERRRIAMTDLFRGPGKSALDTCHEILVGFYLPIRKAGQGSAHRRVMRPQGVAIAILNMAIWLERVGDTLMDIRIAIGPAGPTPLRAHAAEAALRGQVLTPQIRQHGLHKLLEEAHFRTSPHRSTAEYRRQMAEVLFDETLDAAWQRAEEFIKV